MEEYVYNLSPEFTHWFNEHFASYAIPRPDPNTEPCFTPAGKVIARGSWDQGPRFADRRSTQFRFLPHQRLVRDFLTERSPFRGLLLFHKLGSGKTLTAVAVSEALKPRRQVVVMTPAALKDNFLGELRKSSVTYSEMSSLDFEKLIRRDYFFLSFDASNFTQQLTNIPNGLHNKLLIIDEAHNLVSMIGSPNSKKGEAIYNAIMTADNCRVLMLSGTPIINDPFELAIYANLLTGYVQQVVEDGRFAIMPVKCPLDTSNKVLLFQDSTSFYHHFMDTSDPVRPRLIRINALKKRLTGCISYYGGLQPQDKILPDVEMHFVPVEMSPRQYEVYQRVRQIERLDEGRRRRRIARGLKSSSNGAEHARGRKVVDLQNLFSSGKREDAVSAFRAQSRQLCNFVFPPGIPRFIPKLGDINGMRHHVVDNGVTADEDASSISKEVDKMHADSLETIDAGWQKFLVEELHVHAPKWSVMLSNLVASEGPAYVYSQYRTVAGIAPFALALKAHGFIEYGWNDAIFSEQRPMPSPPLPHTRDSITGKTWRDSTARERETFRPLTYIFWPKSSSLQKDSARKAHLLDVFNGEPNKNGHFIKVFLSTKTGAEGLNLMNVRQVHIMEPYWNQMLVRQAVGRAVRQCSHSTLPPSSRRVDAYVYCATMDTFDTTEDIDEKGRPQTTDQYVLAVAEKKQHAIDQVERIMKEVAVDCRLNEKHNKIGDDYVCFEPSELQSQLVLDASQEPIDSSERFGKRDFRVVRLAGKAYRIFEEDLEWLKRTLKEGHNPALSFKSSIPLHHRISNRVVAMLEALNNTVRVVKI